MLVTIPFSAESLLAFSSMCVQMSQSPVKKAKLVGVKRTRDAEDAAATAASSSSAAAAPKLAEESKTANGEAAQLQEALFNAQDKLKKTRRLLAESRLHLQCVGSAERAWNGELMRHKGEGADDYKLRRAAFSRARTAASRASTEFRRAESELYQAQLAVGLRQLPVVLKDSAFRAAMADTESKDGEYRAFAWFLRAWTAFAATTEMRESDRADGNRSASQMFEVLCNDAREAGIKDVPIVNELADAEHGDDEDGEPADTKASDS